MIYNVKTKELYTDNGVLLKKMDCPIHANWENMVPGSNELEKICLHCNKTVLNTDYLLDEEVLFLLKKGDRCLKVNAKII
jgi:hypothetical protein